MYVAWIALHPWPVVVHKSYFIICIFGPVESPRGEATAAACRSSRAEFRGMHGLLAQLLMSM